jgi:hypothetical protein
MKKTLLLTALSVIALSVPAYAEEGHAHESSSAHGDSHGHTAEKPHFNIQKPETVEAAWAMIDETIAVSRQALKDNNADVLHEAGEKLASAVSTLHDHPQAVKEENGEKLTQALDQLSKTADRFHHAAEDKDIAGTTESLDILESQKELVKSLYPSVEQMEP